MNLIHRTSFTWLEPADPATRRTLTRLDEIDRILDLEADAAAGDETATEPNSDDTPAAALTKERAKLAKSLTPAAQWRITVKTGSVLDMARREAYRREAREWYTDNTPDTDDAPPAELIRQNAIWQNLNIWALARALTERLEERTVSRLDLDSDAGWKETATPAWMETAAAWLETVPDALADAWLRAVMEVNPGILDTGQPDEAKKKYGGASATR